MKRCADCGIEKQLSAFSKSKQTISGYTYNCKKCRSMWAREYYHDSPRYRKKVKKRSKQWYEKNKTKLADKYRIKRDYINSLLEKLKLHPACPSCRCYKEIKDETL